MSTVNNDKVFARSIRTLYETHLMSRLITPLCVATLAASVAAQQSLPPQPTSIDGAAAHVYKTISGTELRLHVFSPGNGNSTSKPTVVFFFGGGWTTGSVEQFSRQAAYFATRGMVPIRADYRIASKHHTEPDAAVEDARTALRWVRRHANELGIDPNRIVAAGGSAGGTSLPARPSAP